MSVRTRAQSVAPESSSALVKQRGSFPFLSLPPEIQTMVIEYYVRSRKIHILSKINSSFPNKRPASLMHKSCIINEEQATRWRNDKSKSWAYPHLKCVCPPHGHRIPVPDKMDIGLLSVNKQIHMEANHILYSSQTFSFDKPETLRGFCDIISPSQRRALRKIELTIDIILVKKTNVPLEVLSSRIRGYERQWPEDVLPALERVTDLGLNVSIREDSLASNPTKRCLFDRVTEVADGKIEAFHKVLRWQFGFLRQLKNLRKVVVNIDDSDHQLDADYLPIITAKFEGELLSHSVEDIIQAETLEEGYRKEQWELTGELSWSPYVRMYWPLDKLYWETRASELLCWQTRTFNMADKLGNQLQDVERTQQDGEMGKSLRANQDALDQATKRIREIRERLSKPFDRTAAELRCNLLHEKIAAHNASVLQYIQEFESSRDSQN